MYVLVMSRLWIWQPRSTEPAIPNGLTGCDFSLYRIPTRLLKSPGITKSELGGRAPIAAVREL